MKIEELKNKIIQQLRFHRISCLDEDKTATFIINLLEEYRSCDELPGKEELTSKLIEVSSVEQTKGGVKTTTYFADIVDLFYSIASPIIASRDARIRELEEALRGIAEGKGRYDTDKLIHASNTIQDMIQLANNALTPTNL